MSRPENLTGHLLPLLLLDIRPNRVKNDHTQTDFQQIFWNSNRNPVSPTDPYAASSDRFYMSLFSACGVVLNMFVLVVGVSSTHLMSLRNTYLVMSLSVADLLVCAGVMPLTSVMRNVRFNTRHFLNVCAFWYFFTTFACATSSLNICAIAIDRYIFITAPLLYDMKMTAQRMRLLLVMTWVLGVVIASTSFINSYDAFSRGVYETSTVANTTILRRRYLLPCLMIPQPAYALVMVIIVLFLPSCLIMVLYARIYTVVRQQKEAIRGTQVSLGSNRSRRESMVYKSQHELRPKSQHDLRRKPRSQPELWRKSKSQPDLRSHSKYDVRSMNSKMQIDLHQNTCTVRSLLDLRAKSSGHELPTKSAHEVRPHAMAKSENTNAARHRVNSSTSLGQVTPQKLSSLFSSSFKGSYTGRLLKQETKASIVLGTVIGTYMLCWIPFGIFTMLEIIARREFEYNVREVLLCLGYSNSCWNPLIYAGLNQVFRFSVWRRFQRLRRQRDMANATRQISKRLSLSRPSEILGFKQSCTETVVK